MSDKKTLFHDSMYFTLLAKEKGEDYALKLLNSHVWKRERETHGGRPRKPVIANKEQ